MYYKCKSRRTLFRQPSRRNNSYSAISKSREKQHKFFSRGLRKLWDSWKPKNREVGDRDDHTMESVEDGEEPNSGAHITDIPEEILELIFGHLSPYEDMKSAMLVCKQWHRVVSGRCFNRPSKVTAVELSTVFCCCCCFN